MVPFYEKVHEQLTVSSTQGMNFPAHFHDNLELYFPLDSGLTVMAGGVSRDSVSYTHLLLFVIDAAHGGDGVTAQVGADDEGLGLAVRDTADAHPAVHIQHVPLELGAEGRVFNIVNGPFEPPGGVDRHAAPAGAKVGMVVYSEKEVGDTVLFLSLIHICTSFT